MKLAALQRRISRESKALNESDESLPNASRTQSKDGSTGGEARSDPPHFVASRETLRNSKAIGASVDRCSSRDAAPRIPRSRGG